MSMQMVVMVFKFNMSAAEYLRTMKPLTVEILTSPGLRWKIWLVNETQQTVGGLYLFDDSACVQTFLDSPLVDRLQHHPGFTEFCVMPFEVLEPETKSTHGPLGAGMRV